MDEPQSNPTDEKITFASGQPNYADAALTRAKKITFASGQSNYADAALTRANEILSSLELQSEYARLTDRTTTNYLKISSLKKDTEIAQQATSESITNILHLISEVKDEEVRTRLLSEFNTLEENAKKSTELELERQRILMQLDADERRAKTRMRYFDRFLERESAATILGAIILVLLTIALLIAMYTQDRAREIVYSGFLILLGYFFGQTAGRAANNSKSTDS